MRKGGATQKWLQLLTALDLPESEITTTNDPSFLQNFGSLTSTDWLSSDVTSLMSSNPQSVTSPKIILQEGSIDSFPPKTYTLHSLTLNETTLLCIPPSIIELHGLHTLFESILKSSNNFKIVAIRLQRFTVKQADEYCKLRENTDKYKLTENLVTGSPSLIISLECDNSVTRVLKLISQGADKPNSATTPKKTRTNGFRRRDNDGECFEDEEGKAGCYGSWTSKGAKEEIKLFFGRIWGEDTLS